MFLRILNSMKSGYVGMFGRSELASEDSEPFLDPSSIDLDSEDDSIGISEKKELSFQHSRLQFSQIWTSNFLLALISVALFDFHMGFVSLAVCLATQQS